MDAKDLRTEAALGDRSNDGNTKYAQSGGALPCHRNKTYQDIGSNSLAKVDAPTARPCAVIGPDRVVPPPAPSDAFIKKGPLEPWLIPESAYRRPPEYPHKLLDYQHPSRNISPRQTFQENMQRIMVPPSYNAMKLKEDHNFPGETNITQMRNNKLNVPTDSNSKYCDVPYSINSITTDQKNIRNSDVSVSNMNTVLARGAPHGWPPTSSNNQPSKSYHQDLCQYPEYQNCAAPRPMMMTRPQRTVHEEPGPVYPDAYYHNGNMRFKPYPQVKERYQQPRYEYIGNYSNPFHPPPSFPTHKYELQKPLSTHPYPSYPQVPPKYLDSRIADPIMNGYQRSLNQQAAYNNIPFRSQVIHPTYGPIPGNSLPTNKYYPYPPDIAKSMPSNKLPYDANNKLYSDYESSRCKNYPIPDGFYINEIPRSHPPKGTVLPPSYSTNIHHLPTHPYYRKETLKGYEYSSHFRNMDHTGMHGNPMYRFPSQFSPSAIAISPSDSNTSNDTNLTQGTSQDDCGYVSQSSTASVRSMESGMHRIPDAYRRYDYRYGPIIKNSAALAKLEKGTGSVGSKDKKDIDVRQFLQMWNEGEEEGGENINKEVIIRQVPNNVSGSGNSNNFETTSQEQLYVLGLVNVPSEELGKYEHIQKVSKLPENIKGYNSIELLHQFEEVIESSNLNHYHSKSSATKNFQASFNGTISMHGMSIPSRPISPLDVEAKISQSVIHKDVGCNFEIKPCSPKMLNVEVATPVQSVIGERIIEKVSNSLIIHNVNESSTDYTIMKSQDDLKIASCKMVNKPYGNKDVIDSVRNNYSIQDLESNSGVCLASLPRLDNDIELSFPEVNQQFINANKADSVITLTPLKELPPLDINQSTITNSKQDTDPFIKSSLKSNQDKDFSKLSKYRKLKKKDLGSNTLESNVQALRTDSVIIKNPDNFRSLENLENSSMTEPKDNQDDPINLSVSTEHRIHTDGLNFCTNKLNDDKPNDFAIDFSISANESDVLINKVPDNNSADIDNLNCLSPRQQDAALSEVLKMEGNFPNVSGEIKPVENNFDFKTDISYSKQSYEIREIDDGSINFSKAEPQSKAQLYVSSPDSSYNANDEESLAKNIPMTGLLPLPEKEDSLNEKMRELFGEEMSNVEEETNLHNFEQEHDTQAILDDNAEDNIQKPLVFSDESFHSNDEQETINCTIIKDDSMSKEQLLKKRNITVASTNILLRQSSFENQISQPLKYNETCEVRIDQQNVNEELILDKMNDCIIQLKDNPKSDLCRISKELLSPWIQKLIVHDEGSCGVTTSDSLVFNRELEASREIKYFQDEKLETYIAKNDNKYSDLETDKNVAKPENNTYSNGVKNIYDYGISYKLESDTSVKDFAMANGDSGDNRENNVAYSIETAKNVENFEKKVDTDTKTIDDNMSDGTFVNDTHCTSSLEITSDCTITDILENNTPNKVSITDNETKNDENMKKSIVLETNMDYKVEDRPKCNVNKAKLLKDNENADDLQTANDYQTNRKVENETLVNVKSSNDEQESDTCNNILESVNNKEAKKSFETDKDNKTEKLETHMCIKMSETTHDYGNDENLEKNKDFEINIQSDQEKNVNFKNFNKYGTDQESKTHTNVLMIDTNDSCEKLKTDTYTEVSDTTNDYKTESKSGKNDELEIRNCNKLLENGQKQKNTENFKSDAVTLVLEEDDDICDVEKHSEKLKSDGLTLVSEPVDNCRRCDIQKNNENLQSDALVKDLEPDLNCHIVKADTNGDRLQRPSECENDENLNSRNVCSETLDSSYVIKRIEVKNEIYRKASDGMIKEPIIIGISLPANENTYYPSNSEHVSLNNSPDDMEIMSPTKFDIDPHELIVGKHIKHISKTKAASITDILDEKNVSLDRFLNNVNELHPKNDEDEYKNAEDVKNTSVILSNHEKNEYSNRTPIIHENLIPKACIKPFTPDNSSFDVFESNNQIKTTETICSIWTDKRNEDLDRDFNKIQYINDINASISKIKPITESTETDVSLAYGTESLELTSCSDVSEANCTSELDNIAKSVESNVFLSNQINYIPVNMRDHVVDAENKDKGIENETNLPTDDVHIKYMLEDTSNLSSSDVSTAKTFNLDIESNINNCEKAVARSLYSESLLNESNVLCGITTAQRSFTDNDNVDDNIDYLQGLNIYNDSFTKNIIHASSILETSNEHAEYGMINDVESNEVKLSHVICKKDLYSKNYLSNRRKSFKRSLSDSALDHIRDKSTEELEESELLWPSKRKKDVEVNEDNTSHIITENVCQVLENNRRNSISSAFNEENVSFCILIDNNCIISEDCDDSDKICISEMTGDCLTCIQEEEESFCEENSSAEVITLQEDVNSEYSASLDTNFTERNKSIDEPWVEDVACVETVISEDIAENIVISASTSPKSEELNDEETEIYDFNAHTDKLKWIYGDKMYSNDAHFVETLYRTPQMNVNKTLNNIESQSTEDYNHYISTVPNSDDCSRFYDKESLERVLSESNVDEEKISDDAVLQFKMAMSSPVISEVSLDDNKTLRSDRRSTFRPDTPLLLNKKYSNNIDSVCEINECIENEDYSILGKETELKRTNDIINSCESSIDDVFSYKKDEESPICTNSSSPEVSSTTSEEINSGIVLKITNYCGSRVSQVTDINPIHGISCKYTEKKDYLSSNGNLPTRTLMTKGAQKYIPPLKETIRDLKVKLPLSSDSLVKFRQLKLAKEAFKLNKERPAKSLKKEATKKPKPKFEDVLKSIDEMQYQKHRESNKKTRKSIPKVVIKKNENGSHYASTSGKIFNPDLTGRKWQPWVFLEKDCFIDKMALRKKTRAIFNHRKKSYVLAEKFQKYKSICNSKFVISQPKQNDSSSGHLKYTIRLKHNY